MGMYSKTLSINSKVPVFRYEITIQSEQGLPVYDSSFEYRLNQKEHTTNFIIPDYPPQKLAINYSIDSNMSSKAIVTAWKIQEDGTLAKEVETLSLDTK